MPSSIVTIARAVFGPQPEIFCEQKVWDQGIAELRRRAGGRRESGAFLLGTKERARRIEEFIFYDDVDVNALRTGMVIIDGRKLGDLWAHCRATGREVVADVHVHPGAYHQSGSDQDNPVMAEVGHIAIILPNYAQRAVYPGRIGIFEYLGGRHWRDRSRQKPSPLHVGWWPSWR